MRIPVLLLIAIPLASCGTASAKKEQPPSHAELIAHETELLKLTLTPDAQRRLGIATTRAGSASATGSRQAMGEIVVPPSGAGGVPTGSLADLQQLGLQQALADGEMKRTSAQARLARIALVRADGLVREEAGSVRARDEAAAALASANAAWEAAREQRRLLGPAIAAMNTQPILWVRTSIFAADVQAVQRGAAIRVRALGTEATGDARTARPVQGPPSASVAAGTIDLFYAISNADRAFRVGQRVAVELPLGGQVDGLSVPSSAIVRDIYGGEWVYRKTAPDTYVRQRIAVASENGGTALVSQGLFKGAEIVVAGAAELFGTEFGAAH